MAAFLIFAMLCVGIFAGIRWNNGSQSNDPPPPTTQRADVKTKDRGSTSKAETRQAEKERYSDKLPAEGMPVRCLQYTTLGAPDKRLDCKNFDRLELGQKYFNVYWSATRS